MLLSTSTATAFPSLPFPDHHRAKRPISIIAPSKCPLLIRLSRTPDGSHRGAVAVSSATEAAVEALDAVEEAKEKLEVAVKVQEKSRLVLKFIWMEKNIGLALDQAVPGHGTIPLCPYYFWPRKDAWEELKTLLESKPWISQKRMIILLNQATDIINLWQQSGGGL